MGAPNVDAAKEQRIAELQAELRELTTPPNPHAQLREYLASVGAPADAYQRIVDGLGWHPPALWEAARDQAEILNKSVVAPEGMVHVGYYCEHPLSKEPPYGRATQHRTWARNKRGWKWSKNTSKGLTFGDYNSDLLCPEARPIFVRLPEVES